MEKKKNLTIEELTKACEEAKNNFEEAKNNFEVLSEQLIKAKQEEEDKKKAQRALEMETRKKEVDDAYETYNILLKAYIKDYGSYSATHIGDAIFPEFLRSFF